MVVNAAIVNWKLCYGPYQKKVSIKADNSIVVQRRVLKLDVDSLFGSMRCNRVVVKEAVDLTMTTTLMAMMTESFLEDGRLQV